jgi:hypothetical protein
VNGAGGKAPIGITAIVGVPVTLDAAGTRDPDGHALQFHWFFYPEAGTGIPGQPVAIARARPAGGGGVPSGGIPSQPPGGPRELPPRVTLSGDRTPRVTVTPLVAGTAHVILAVGDAGAPALTSYRRVIITIRER